MKKITVIGSTGMIGIPVTKELVKMGYAVTTLVRNPDKAMKLLPSEVTIIKGDLNNKQSIAEALKYADGLYINLSTTGEDKEGSFNPETHGLDTILEMAKQAPNLKHIAYLSSFLARNYQGNWWVFKTKKSSIIRVKNSGIPYSIFYPSNFMENFNGGMKDGKKINTIGKSTEKAWWIAGEDFGKMVANSFKSETALNIEYPVQGLEGLTMAVATNIYVNNYSKEKLSIANLPMGMAKFLALFIKPLKFVVPLMQVMNSNKETFESQKTWDELGKPQLTLAEFAKQS